MACAIPGCNNHCSPNKLMCFGHWKMVPQDIQKRVYQHYRSGDKGQHGRACIDAIRSVHEQTKK